MVGCDRKLICASVCCAINVAAWGGLMAVPAAPEDVAFSGASVDDSVSGGSTVSVVGASGSVGDSAGVESPPPQAASRLLLNSRLILMLIMRSRVIGRFQDDESMIETAPLG